MQTNPIKSLIAVSTLAFLGTPAFAQVVKVDGSSTVYPVTEAVAEEFQKANKGMKVTVGVSGTGGGFKKFCRGETDISNASRPIAAKEMEACRAAGVEYFEVPVAFDALTVVINPKNAWLKQATVAELKKLWEPEAQGKVTHWNQVNPAWPNQPIKLFGAGADSGTFDYFTEAIVGKSKSSRGDFTASEDDNVLVQGVSRDVGGLGYFGFAYYIENKDKLKAVPIVNPKTGKAVEPSLEAVISGEYQPLSRPIFIYVSVKAAAKPHVDKFVNFYLGNAAALSAKVGYVGLPANVGELVQKRYTAKTSGSVFSGGSKVGVTLEQLLASEGGK